MLEHYKTEAAMAVTAEKSAPYAPAKTITDLIERYRSRGLPSPVNAEVLGRAGVSESLIPRTLQALQTLDLIDETGKPTQTFEGIRLAPEGEYKKRLEDWLKGAYADVFSFVDPTTDDEVRVRDAFRNYQPMGQQARMVTLFMGLCAAAGLLPEKTQQARPAPRPRTTTAQSSKRATPPKPKPLHLGAHFSDSGSNLPPALSGLMASLPSPATGWTQADRDKFVTTFQTVLDYAIPIVEQDADDEGEEDFHEKGREPAVALAEH